jgi:double-stranded uracil-DNA glycosylase
LNDTIEGEAAKRIVHPFAPVFDQASRILLLGTMASVSSRNTGFYYGHPQNRFWRILSDVFCEDIPQMNEEKEKFCHRHHIALWDVLQSCEIVGSDDGSIRNPVPQPVNKLLLQAPIEAVFATGQKAQALYRRLIYPVTGIVAIALPSTSPANCRFYSYGTLLDAYKAILPFCGD